MSETTAAKLESARLLEALADADRIKRRRAVLYSVVPIIVSIGAFVFLEQKAVHLARENNDAQTQLENLRSKQKAEAALLADTQEKLGLAQQHLQEATAQDTTADARLQQTKDALSGAQAQLKAAQSQDETLHTELTTDEARYDALKRERDQVQQDLESDRKQVDALRQETAALKASIGAISGAVQNTGSASLKTQVGDLTTLQAVVTPQAHVELVPGQTAPNGQPLRRYTLSIDVPTGRMNEITKVDYFFNNPTFVVQHLDSSDAATHFQVEYRGWGCLQNVIITIYRASGAPVVLDFEQCKSLGVQ